MTTMKKHWYQILQDINNAVGKEKLEVMKSHKDNETLKDVLHFVYNPRIVTGISEKKLSKQINPQQSFIEDDVITINELMEYLQVHNTGRDYDLLLVQNYLSKVSDLELDMTKAIVLKDLPIGISASTINKAWPNLVPVFKLMKGKKYEAKDINVPFTLSLKLDGNSATVFNLEDETYILSRSGAVMQGLEHIENYYRENFPLGYVYCGEILAYNTDFLTHSDLFRLSNGIINSTKSDQKSETQHIVFDRVPYTEYQSGKFTEPFSERRDDIIELFKKYKPYESHHYNLPVMRVPYFQRGITDNELISSELQKVNLDGLEGLMLNFDDDVYKFGPAKGLQKVKEFYTMDLLVVDLVEHVRGGKVGSLVVQYKDNIVGVSGIEDVLRTSWWNSPFDIIGKVVEVGYFRKSKDKNGKESLQFPSFVRIRHDKTAEDISYD